jgi:hypothetical protein
MSILRKNRSTLIQLHVDGTLTDNPVDVADAFAKQKRQALLIHEVSRSLITTRHIR